MTVGRKRTRHVNPMHQAATQQSAQHIRIVGQNEFRHLGLRVSYGASLKRVSFIHG
jgi:hypothetical protein